MRCYHFGNFYLSSIQQGIQAAHAQMELFVKYREICVDYDNINPSIEEYEYQQQVDDLYDWAENHKTMVCVNGGNLQGLKDIELLFQTDQNKFPWATFYEDEMSLGSLLTNVCIVLPEYIYENAAKIRNREYTLQDNKVWDELGMFVVNLTEFEIKLIQLLNSCQLAR